MASDGLYTLRGLLPGISMWGPRELHRTLRTRSSFVVSCLFKIAHLGGRSIANPKLPIICLLSSDIHEKWKCLAHLQGVSHSWIKQVCTALAVTAFLLQAAVVRKMTKKSLGWPIQAFFWLEWGCCGPQHCALCQRYWREQRVRFSVRKTA